VTVAPTAMGKQRRAKNLAVAGILVAMVVLFYIITVVRMGGQ